MTISIMMQSLFIFALVFCLVTTRVHCFSPSCSVVHNTIRQLIRTRHQSSTLRHRRTRHFGSNNNDGDNSNNNIKNVNLDKEEPLSVIFQRAVALHRAGALDEALGTYELFLKAAAQCNVSPDMYAEIHVNIGAIQLKNPQFSGNAKSSFETALKYRSNIGTAHVNLALLILKELSSITDTGQALQALQEAKGHCQDAINSNDGDARSMAAATKIMQDIDRMINQTGFQ